MNELTRVSDQDSRGSLIEKAALNPAIAVIEN